MRIQIIGASGSGKSTIGRRISQKTGVYWIDTDRYLWKGGSFTENHPVEERFRMYREDLANHPDYIASGSVYSWNPDGFLNREFLVLITVDEKIRMKRLYDREFSNFGERMLPGGDHYEATREFLDWCGTYLTGDENAACSLASHRLRLKEAKCRTLVLDGGRPPDVLCESILNAYRGG